MRLPPFKPSGVPTALSATIAIITLTLLFLGLSDADIALRFLRLGNPLPDAQAVVIASARAIRLLLAFDIVLLAGCFILIFARQDSSPAESVASAPSMVLPQDEGLRLATSVLADSRITELCIWGFSLQWATPLYRYLRDHRHPSLTVRLFVAGDPAWSDIVEYPNVSKTALRTRRDTSILEWLSLARERMVGDVRIYQVAQLANDKGVMIGDKLTLLGTYDYDVMENSRLAFQPQPDRFFLASVESDTQYARMLNRWCKQRLACRRFDCQDITDTFPLQ